MKISQPTSLVQAFQLASLHEESILIQQKYIATSVSKASNITHFTPKEEVSASKRLTPLEVQEHHWKGLCYKCDDKFSLGYWCKAQLGIIEIFYPGDTVDDSTHDK